MGGARSSRGRIPIGQKKSVLWSVGSKNLRVEEEGFVVVEELQDEEEGIEEEDDMEEEDTREDETENDAEEVEDVVAGHSYSSSSSSNTMEERSIGGSAALFEKAEFQS